MFEQESPTHPKFDPNGPEGSPIRFDEEPLTLLMIDDEPADGEMVRRYLDDGTVPWATELEVALSLDEALSVLGERTVDVLIIDYRFPFGNGFDVLSRVRQEGVDAPAIMLTGEGSESVAARAVKHELQDYVPKGDLTSETLREALDTALTDHAPGPASGSGTEPTESADRVDAAGLDRLLPKISTKLRSRNPLRILGLLVPPGTVPEPTDAGPILEETFREVALEPLTFHPVNPNVFVSLLEDSLARTVSLEDPLENLPELLGDVLADPTVAPGENGDATVEGALLEAEESYRDPAALLNDSLDALRHKTEGGDRLERLSIPGAP